MRILILLPSIIVVHAAFLWKKTHHTKQVILPYETHTPENQRKAHEFSLQLMKIWDATRIQSTPYKTIDDVIAADNPQLPQNFWQEAFAVTSKKFATVLSLQTRPVASTSKPDEKLLNRYMKRLKELGRYPIYRQGDFRTVEEELAYSIAEIVRLRERYTQVFCKFVPMMPCSDLLNQRYRIRAMGSGG